MSELSSAAVSARELARGSDGRFGEQRRADPGQVVVDPQRLAVADLLARGEVAPAAADMEPGEVLWQYVEANGLSLREQQELVDQYGLAGVSVRVDGLVAGDLVDLGPVIREFGDSSVDAADVVASGREMATLWEVEWPDDGLAAPVLHTDQGSWAVSASARLNVRLGGGRCGECGDPASGGLCDDCAG